MFPPGLSWKNTNSLLIGGDVKAIKDFGPSLEPPFLPGGVNPLPPSSALPEAGFSRGGAIFGPDYVGNRFQDRFPRPTSNKVPAMIRTILYKKPLPTISIVTREPSRSTRHR